MERLRLRFSHGLLLDRLPLSVEPVEFRSEPARLERVLHQKEPRAERRVSDPPACVDAGTDEITEMPAFGHPGKARRVEERRQACATARPHHRKTLADERAIEARKRYDV